MFRQMNGHINGEVPGQQQRGQGQQQPPPLGFIAGHLGLWSFLGLLLIMAAIIGGLTGWNKTHQHHVATVASLWCVPNVTVSLDGSLGAKFSTISEAVQAAPNFTSTRYCIYIRAGIYAENVVVGPEKTNLVFLGDGLINTVLAGSGNGTLQTATLSVKGDGFIAVDMTIDNSMEAAINLSTVAVENWSDRSIFYRCSLRSSHGVLRANLMRQFYRDCDFEGSSGSLISGKASAFFQKCGIAIDEGRTMRKNVTYIVAEQSVEGTNLKGGFVFHMCNISAAHGDPAAIILGAALKNYSHIAYLKCAINVKAARWSRNGFGGGNIEFSEYGNTRFGSPYRSSSSDHVRVLNLTAASQLALGSFFPDDWIPADIPHKADLAK